MGAISKGISRGLATGGKTALKASVSKPGLAAIGAGGVTATALGVKKVKEKEDNKRKFSGYKKHVARNLRSGNLTVNNLSDQDVPIASKMHKISSLMNVAFTGMMAKGIPDAGKAKRQEYQIQSPSTPPSGGTSVYGTDRNKYY